MGQDFFAEREVILSNHWKRLGPIYLTPRLLIRNLGYSDNIYRFSELAQGDWTLDLGLQVQTDLLIGRRLILSYQIHPEYHLYLKNKALSNWTVGHQLGLHSYLGPFNVRLNGFANQYWGAPNPEYGLSVRYKSNGTDVLLGLGNPRHFNVQITAAQMENEFEDLRYLNQYDLSRLNYRMQSVGLALSLGIFTRTQLALKYQQQWLHYKNLGDLDARIEMMGLSLQLPELSSLRGSINLGMQRFTPRDDRLSVLNTPYGSGSLTLQPGNRWRLLLGYQIRVQDSFNLIDQLFIQNSWSLGGDIYLTRKWRIGYRFNDNALQYRLRSDAQVILQSHRYQMHTAQLAFRVTEKSAIGLTWNRVHTSESTSEWRRDYSFIGGYLETDF